MIDPMTALAGIQSAISMVKKASKVANDLGSLAPMIGKMFDAKSVATKAMLQAKQSGKGSNMGTALQIEMALEQARAFEEELKMLFMQTGKIDVWNKIKARQAENTPLIVVVALGLTVTTCDLLPVQPLALVTVTV